MPKNRWEFILSTPDKREHSDNLVDLVQTAYAKTSAGSFVNSLQDVIPSDWSVLDWDKDPELDIAIFYREARPNETWQGKKIQGIGHDGQRTSKDMALKQMASYLNKPVWWIEAADAIRHIMLKMGAPVVTDEATLQAIFPGTDLTMIDDKTYTRLVDGTNTATESVFGKPIVK